MKILTTLTGPSCAGKSTLETMMAKHGCLKAVSTTTRNPRAGEKHGSDYYFVSREEFDEFEFVERVRFGDFSYGVSVTELERLFAICDHVVLVCEPTGARQIRRYSLRRNDIELRQVFVDNPESVINERFLQRMATDLERAKLENDNSHLQVIRIYARRMSVMSTTEREWRETAYGRAHPARPHAEFKYDQIIERFDESNCNQIVANLLNGLLLNNTIMLLD